jgi:serine phosphatase RsbU (regulator of sigma subunit)/anti-sigma regulatory factor (Ser/Thr protein kinase)
VDEHDDLIATADFQPQPTAVAAARRFVRETLNSWQLPCRDDLVSDAVLLTSELVTNAVVHAGTRVQVVCRLHGADIEVSVLDRHPARVIPDPPTGSSDRPSGRGLLLPGALSSSWGVTYAAAAKVVWFRLGLRARPYGAPAIAERSNGRRPVDFAPPPVQPGGADQLHGGYRELLSHAVELGSAALAADAVHALIVDEDGELRIRTAVTRRATETAQAAAGTEEDPVGRPTDAHLDRMQQIADRVTASLERARLSEHDRAWRGRMSFLAEASHLLAGTLDEDRTIALAAQLVVPRLAAWCAVLLPDEGGELRLAYCWHADESRADALTGLLNQSPPPKVLPGAGAQRWSLAATRPEQVTEMAAELASDPAWCLPLRARDRNLGVLVIGGAMARDALDLAEDLALRAALALDNARLYSQQLQATHALQRSLLPPELPDIPGVDLAAAYQAAGDGNEVGGDFYDVFEVAEGRWRFAIGDVCGKGPEAAAVTGLTRHALRILAKEGHDVPAVLERLNALLLSDGSRVPFVTLIYGELVPVPGGGAAISLACAGHPLPLILRSAGGVQAGAKAQPLLGVLDAVTFRTDNIRLSASDVLLCVTDGVTERRAFGRLLDDDNGLSHLLGECSALNAGAIAARVKRAVDEFGAGPPADDQALIVFRGL